MKPKHYLLIAIIISTALIINGYISYRKTLEQIEAKSKIDQANMLRAEMMYQKCRSDAYSMYTEDWDSSCDLLGREADCSLPGYLADDHNEKRETDEANCVKLYK